MEENCSGYFDNFPWLFFSFLNHLWVFIEEFFITKLERILMTIKCRMNQICRNWVAHMSFHPVLTPLAPSALSHPLCPLTTVCFHLQRPLLISGQRPAGFPVHSFSIRIPSSSHLHGLFSLSSPAHSCAHAVTRAPLHTLKSRVHV